MSGIWTGLRCGEERHRAVRSRHSLIRPRLYFLGTMPEHDEPSFSFKEHSNWL